ncbi:MAG TPA: NlpC/P60 family protein [Ilumatobacteraceae bacterium]|nr:NlpC/P60 family protein [Ilumatobacteraceae bacterium]
MAVLTLGSVFTVLLAVLAPAPAEAATVRSISPALAQLSARALDAISDLDDVDDGRGQNHYAIAFDRYTRLRDEAASLAATELGIPAAMLRDAWALSDLDKQTALLAALTQLGVPYRTHRSEAGVGFDCSGLTTYAWGIAGQQLAPQSRAQINAAKRVDRKSAQAGDLMFYPGHVMMFLGIGNAMVHSPQRGSEVEITFLTERHSRNVIYADPTG